MTTPGPESLEPDSLNSEQITLRVPRAMLAVIDMYAAQEDRSRGSMARRLFSEAVTARQLGTTLGPLEEARRRRVLAARAGAELGDPFDPTEADER